MPTSNQCPSVSRLLWAGLALTVGGSLTACSDRGAAVEIVHGDVRCGGRPVDTGDVRFVPAQGTTGRVSSARIVNGAYRIDARGGVPVGTYRVEVNALAKTGRKKTEMFNAEKIEVDETKTVGPALYAGDSSPLTITVPTENGGRFDIEVPRR